MNILRHYFTLRRKLQLGLAYPHAERKHFWLLRVGILLLLLLPWIAVVLGFALSWQTYAIGDEIDIPLWAWLCAVVMPAFAWLLSGMMAGGICLRWYIREKLPSPVLTK